jgi:23S rRNA (uracil1939-C5)-methyltransferase
MTATLRSGAIIETEITDLAFDGRSVGQIDGKIVFFDAGLPGEKVKAQIVKSRNRYNFARVIEIFDKTSDRIPARCHHFDICGGCTWQDLDYSRQLYYKRKQIVDCLKHIGRIDKIEVEDAVGASDQFFYRNKMEFSFNALGADDFTLGLHMRGHFDKIFDLKECLLQSPLSNEIVEWVRQFVKENRIPIYNVTSHNGFIRFLVIREARHTGQVMINLVTADGAIPRQEELLADLIARFPRITTVIQNINTAKSNIARGEREKILYGPGFIEERLFQYRFRIYANSFFQTNTAQAEKLYSLVYEMLKAGRDDSLLDLYCGTGTIGIGASGMVGKVTGVELEPSALRAAQENVSLNGIKNIDFHIGSVQELMADRPDIFENITCTVIDPPRAGMHPKALRRLAELHYPRLVYVSCNPATFARDAAYLIDRGYKISRIVPIDMFPHTMHIELVARYGIE